MKNRNFLRTNYGTSSWSGTIPSACIIPDKSFSPSTHNQTTSGTQIMCGSIDSSSGLAYVIQREESGADCSTVKYQLQMILWKHRVYASNEETEELNVLATCVHPELYHANDAMPCSSTLACLVPVSSRSKTAGLGLYWCSPCGVLCYYDSILNRGSSLEPQTLTRIPLDEDEHVTFVSASVGQASGGSRTLGEVLFVGTSSSRIWICTRCTRPLELKVRLLDSSRPFHDDVEAGKYWLGGLVSKFFTPSKQVTSRHQSLDPIVSILAMSGDVTSVKRPLKGQKVVHPSSVTNSATVIDHLFFIINRSGIISTCAIAYNLQEKGYTDQYLHSINLRSRMKRLLTDLHSKDPEIIDKTINFIQVLNAAIDDAGTCISICVKAVFTDAAASADDFNTIGRLYMLYCPIHPQEFSVTLGSLAWLSRYTSDTILSHTNSLQCAGMTIQSAGEMEYVDVSVYSVIQSPNENINQDEKPVTISGIHFSRFPDDVRKQIQVQIRDVDLPFEIVPFVIPGAVGIDSSTDGFVSISSTGSITSTRLTFPILSSSSPRKSDTVSKETIQLLKSHLLSEYMIYKRRLEHRHLSVIGLSSNNFITDQVPLSTSTLPPSIMHADSAELTLAAVEASKSLMDDRFGTHNRNGSKSIVSNFNPTIVLEVLDEKCEAHLTFIDFLISSQLYKKVDTSGRIQLRNHGELLNGLRGMIITWQDILEGTLLVKVPDVNPHFFEEEQSKINQRLLGCEETLSDIQARLNSIQLLLYDEGSLKVSALLTHYVFILFGQLAKDSLVYRQQSSDNKYDIMCSPGFFGWDEGNPWTSEDDYMSLLEGQLALVETATTEEKDVFMSNDFSTLIETFSCQLLDGFRDKNCNIRDENRYDAAKRLCLSLVQKFCPQKMSEADIDLSFYLSLRHCYFDGIVEACVDHFQSNKGKTKIYDLNCYLRSVTAVSLDEEKDDDVYYNLAAAKDYRTGLSFPQFVFRWFSDRKLFGTVLELGKCCPDVLTQYMIEDSRFSHLLWIQYVKNQDIVSATRSLSTQGLIGSVQQQDDAFTKNPVLLLSLGKLCNAAR